MRRWPVRWAVAALAWSCAQRPAGLAVVAGKTITLSQLTVAVEQATGKSWAQVSPEVQSAFFEALLEEEVLLAAGGGPEDQELTGAARSRRARELLQQLCPSPPPPSPEELSAFLQQQGEPPARDLVRLRQLILPSRAQAEEARERILRGEDFHAVSQALSRAPNAATGGALGWIDVAELTPEFAAAVAPLRIGELSQPVQSGAGWHVFQVLERGGRQVRAEGEARDQLWAQKNEVSRRACLRELAKKIGVRVFCANAPFPCRNPFEEEP